VAREEEKEMILALDPTLSAFGAALFDLEGNLKGLSCIKPDKNAENDQDKGISLSRQLSYLIEKHGVTDIVAEVITGFMHSKRAAESIYKAEGVILGVVGAKRIAYHSVSIYDVKMAATGRKTEVSKHDMIEAALKLAPIPPLSCKKDGKIHIGKAEHEADAIFVGMAYLTQRKYREAISKEVDKIYK
jgi:Holliday junction resolvasome RuvABC endonuclease subunit